MTIPLRFLSLGIGLALLAGSTVVTADDLAPPSYRGLPHSVMAKFDLFGGQTPGPPAQFSSVGGVYPLSQLAPEVGLPQTDPTNGALIYPIGLPNFIDPLPLKRIRIQYSWFGSTSGPTGDAQTLNIFPSPSGVVQLVGSSGPSLVTGNIYHRWDDYEIIPNPDSERFEIAFFDADPRWIIIDTISVPEPTGLLLIVLGGIVVGSSRRR